MLKAPLIFTAVAAVVAALLFYTPRARVPAHLSNHPVLVVKDLIPADTAIELIELIKNFTDFTSNVDQSKAQGFKPLHEHIGEAEPINDDGTCTHKFLFPNPDKTLCITPQRVDIGKHYVLTGGIDGFKETYRDLVDRVSSFGRYTFVEDIDKFPAVKRLFSSRVFQESALQVCPNGQKHLDPFQFNFIINVPGQTVAVHIDSPYFWGASRFTFPQWLLVAMVFSGLFADRFVHQVQVVGYLHQGDKGGQGGRFAWFDNDTSLQYIDPLPNSGSFVDGSKVLHASQVYRPHQKAPHLDKNKDGLLRYVGSDQWVVMSGEEVVSRYSTDDLRISIVYRARCFKDRDTAAEYRVYDRVMDLESDIIDKLKSSLVERKVASAAKLSTVSRLQLAFLIIDSYIKYPLPPVEFAAIPFNYCAAPLIYPWTASLPFFGFLCNDKKTAVGSTSVSSSRVSSRMTVRPLQGARRFAAEVTGFDFEGTAGGDHVHDLQEALDEHKVLVVRDQGGLSVGALRRLSSHFGALHVHLESNSHLDGYSDVNVVSNIRDPVTGYFKGLYGTHVESFHSDLSYSELPSKATFLLIRTRPDGCGNTLFMDSTAAYDGLRADEKLVYDGKIARYCYLTVRRPDEEGGLTAEEAAAATKCAEHPVITSHPTKEGRRNIFANPSHTSAIVGESEAESTRLLSALYNHASNLDYLYEHVWRDGDLVVWDNRAVQHRATGCPEESPRMLVRTTVLCDHRPEGLGSMAIKQSRQWMSSNPTNSRHLDNCLINYR